MTTRTAPLLLALALAGCISSTLARDASHDSDQRATLLGRAVLPATTFAEGPVSGQLIAPANGVPVPFTDGQPVQGFSAVLDGPRKGTYLVMPDNGYGAKANSADALLRVYAVEPDFQRGVVRPVAVVDGSSLPAFSARSFIGLRDPDHKIGFPIVADMATNPGSAIPVAAQIREDRLLTGGDFDIESVRRAADGTFWFGDEFGPFLLHADAGGRLLEAPIPLPNLRSFGANPLVQSPDNPLRDAGTPANLPGSRGFEGMALDWHGRRLYPMLEGAINDDPVRTRLLIHEFDLARKQYTGTTWAYRLESPAHAIGDFTAVAPGKFVVIERDNLQGAQAAFKRVYKVDLKRVDAEGFLVKQQIADLMDIADERGLGGDGSQDGRFTFPFQTIEDVLPLEERTLLIIDDNNFPFSNGRTPGVPDNGEFILVRTATPLPAGF